MRILVADDDKVVSHLVCSLLRAAGYQVTPAYDAMQTIMFAMRVPVPDAIVLDIAMPGGTGIDALKKLKASARTSLIPVIVLSGSIESDAGPMLQDLGAAAFLTKPVDARALSAALAGALGTAP